MLDLYEIAFTKVVSNKTESERSPACCGKAKEGTWEVASRKACHQTDKCSDSCIDRTFDESF